MRGVNRQVTLRSYPNGLPSEANFEVIERDVPTIDEGEVLGRAIYLTVDPYIRIRISPSLWVGDAPTTPLGSVIPGEAILQVVESRHAGFREGDFVAGFGGWQEYCALPGSSLRNLDVSLGSLPAHLGSLGMPGLTAYAGITHLSQAVAGHTVFVSAALGGVGAMAGQLARIRGCRVVGVTSSPEKCLWATQNLGYDVCLDRKSPDFAERVAAACPEGIDVDFENAGGEVFWAAFNNMNVHGRIIVCGLINRAGSPMGADLSPGLLRTIAIKRLVVRGLTVSDFWDLRPQFLEEVGDMIRAGQIRSKEHVVEGIENAGRAMIDMLEGRTFGKTVVRIAEDPVPIVI
jgi:NADPH-dependent curcumin reductase CurA